MTVREATQSTSATSATLGSLVDALGEGLVRVVTAPRGLDVPVVEVVVHDPLSEPTPGRDDLLLAVGVDAAPRQRQSTWSPRVVRAGRSALLLKDDRELPVGLIAAAEGAGVALLLAPAAAAWGQLHTLMRTARSVSPPRDCRPGRGPAR